MSIKKSISSNAFRVIFGLNITLILIIFIATILFAKNIERNFLQQDFQSERDFIMGEHNTTETFRHRSKDIIVEFIPDSFSTEKPKFSIFIGLPAGHNQLIQKGGNHYFINIELLPTGTFYHARDITLVYKREVLFLLLMLSISAAAVIIGLLLALFFSQRLVSPLKELAAHLTGIEIGSAIDKIDTQFNSIELHNITQVFNKFLLEIDQFIKRERTLVNMASHELRTPISVIMGATEVLHSRSHLSDKELRPLVRIENSAKEMNDNINALLKLSRRPTSAEVNTQVNIQQLLNEIINDLGYKFPVASRISLETLSNHIAYTDPVLVKILLRNIIQNALQHTPGHIWLVLNGYSLDIKDEGTGLDTTNKPALSINQKTHEREENSGLGLYITTLICERIQWHISASRNELKGSTMTIAFDSEKRL